MNNNKIFKSFTLGFTSKLLSYAMLFAIFASFAFVSCDVSGILDRLAKDDETTTNNSKATVSAVKDVKLTIVDKDTVKVTWTLPSSLDDIHYYKVNIIDTLSNPIKVVRVGTAQPKETSKQFNLETGSYYAEVLSVGIKSEAIASEKSDLKEITNSVVPPKAAKISEEANEVIGDTIRVTLKVSNPSNTDNETDKGGIDADGKPVDLSFHTIYWKKQLFSTTEPLIPERDANDESKYQDPRYNFDGSIFVYISDSQEQRVEIPDLPPKTSFAFIIVTTNGDGLEAIGNTIYLTTKEIDNKVVEQAPDAPSNLSAEPVSVQNVTGDTSATNNPNMLLTWDAPKFTGIKLVDNELVAAKLTHYVVYWQEIIYWQEDYDKDLMRPNTNSRNQIWISAENGVLPTSTMLSTKQGLKYNTQYNFMVVAVNDAYSTASDGLKSEASEPYDFATEENNDKATPPSRASITKIESKLIEVTSSTVTEAKAILTFEHEKSTGTDSNGNVAAIKSRVLYWLQGYTAADGQSDTHNDTLNRIELKDNAQEVEVYGLRPGTVYEFYITVTNSAGLASSSESKTTFTPSAPPTVDDNYAARNLSASVTFTDNANTGSGNASDSNLAVQAVLKWDAPLYSNYKNDGTDRIAQILDYYVVYYEQIYSIRDDEKFTDPDRSDAAVMPPSITIKRDSAGVLANTTTLTKNSQIEPSAEYNFWVIAVYRTGTNTDGILSYSSEKETFSTYPVTVGHNFARFDFNYDFPATGIVEGVATSVPIRKTTIPQEAKPIYTLVVTSILDGSTDSSNQNSTNKIDIVIDADGTIVINETVSAGMYVVTITASPQSPNYYGSIDKSLTMLVMSKKRYP